MIDMKSIIIGVMLTVPVLGCESETKREPIAYQVESGKLQNYMFSSDPLVEKTYIDCINNLIDDCKPVKGMTIKQFKELRTLELGSFKAKMDWRDSEGHEQWSEKFTYKNFTRIYTFETGTLVEWVDISH